MLLFLHWQQQSGREVTCAVPSGLPVCFRSAEDNEIIMTSLLRCLLSKMRQRGTQIIVLLHSAISLYSTWFFSNSLALPFESEMRAFKTVKYVRKLLKRMERISVGAFLRHS